MALESNPDTSAHTISDTLSHPTLYAAHTEWHYTSSGVVSAGQSCHGTFTGLSGFWSISSDDSNWVWGGKGNCYTDFTLSVVYKSSGATMHKEMAMIVNGKGIESWWLRNV